LAGGGVVVGTWALVQADTVDDVVWLDAQRACAIRVIGLTVVSHTNRLIDQPVTEIVVTVARTVVEQGGFAVRRVAEVPLHQKVRVTIVRACSTAVIVFKRRAVFNLN